MTRHETEMLDDDGLDSQRNEQIHSARSPRIGCGLCRFVSSPQEAPDPCLSTTTRRVNVCLDRDYGTPRIRWILLAAETKASICSCTTRYDLVIAGADLYPTSGYDVAQTVKRTTQQIPGVIIEGASTNTSPKKLAMHLQPDIVMQAPFSNDELLQTLLQLGLCARHPAEQPGV